MSRSPGVAALMRRPYTVAFASDGSTVVVGGSDGTILLTDWHTGRDRRVLSAHDGTVEGLVFSPDGGRLASAGDDGVVRLWDPATGLERAALLTLRSGWAVLLPDGRYKMEGEAAGAFWWAIKQCRFEPGGLDPYVPNIRRVPADAPI